VLNLCITLTRGDRFEFLYEVISAVEIRGHPVVSLRVTLEELGAAGSVETLRCRVSAMVRGGFELLEGVNR